MIKLTDMQLANVIEKNVLPDSRIFWTASDLPRIRIALKALQVNAQSDSFLIDGVMPYWLYAGIVAALAPSSAALYTPKFGPVVIPRNSPQATGSGLLFKVFEDTEFTLVQFSSPRSLQVDQLSSIIPPLVNPNKGIVISSNTPYWLVSTVVLAYIECAKWVAVTQKSGNAVVIVSHDQQTPLGTELERQKVQEASDHAGVPKRGEIWLFEDGYGERPGVIVSPTERNEEVDDVLIVPFTSRDTFANKHLPIPAAGTGLHEDSYAQCSNISRIEKHQLITGPIGSLPESLLAQVIRAIRLAIGDHLTAL